MTTKTPTTRDPHSGYRKHDRITPWQECDSCGLRLGEGTTTEHDAAYYAGDPAACPRCEGGLMCLPEDDDRESIDEVACSDCDGATGEYDAAGHWHAPAHYCRRCDCTGKVPAP